MPTNTEKSTDDESAELRRFREEWREEVRRRREEQQGATAEPSQHIEHRVPSPQTARSHPSRAPPPATEAKPSTTSVPGASPQKPLHTSHVQSPLSGNIARAVEIYRSAVQHEQESDLGEALRLYRQAFRLNSDVDRAYFKEEQRLQKLGRSTVGPSHKKTASREGTEGKSSRAAPLLEGRELVHANGILSKVLQNFPEILTFEPEDDRDGAPINMIPEELLLYILRNLDTTTLERFATVSRKARVVSLDSSIWRYDHHSSQNTNVTVSNDTLLGTLFTWHINHHKFPRLSL